MTEVDPTALELPPLDAALSKAGVATRPATALTDHFDTTADLLQSYLDGESVSDLSGVGSTTATRVSSWIEREYPDVVRARYERGEQYATEFTTDHGIPEDQQEDGEFYWAFICPRCEERNPLVGDPHGFAGRPYACEHCHWVSLLVTEFVDEFAEDHGVVPA